MTAARSLFATVCLLLACSPAGLASVTSYNIIKGVYRFQTSESAPASGNSGNWYAYRRLFSDTPDAFSVVSVAWPDGTVQSVPTFTSTQWLRLTQYASKAALDSAFPTGQYTFSVTSAVTGLVDTGSITLAGDAYALNAPSLTGDSYTRLVQHDWRTPITITFPSLQPNPSATASRMQLYLRDRATGTERFLGTLTPSTTSFTIFACSARPSRNYQLKLVFNCSIRVPDAGFSGTADAFADYDQWVYVNFTTPPGCPADYDCSGTVSVQDVFSFLQLYFAGDARADFNAVGGVTTQDVFDFLGAFFAGC